MALLLFGFFKGGLISEGVFNIVLYSKKWTKSLSIKFSHLIEKMRDSDFAISDGTKVKIFSEIKLP